MSALQVPYEHIFTLFDVNRQCYSTATPVGQNGKKIKVTGVQNISVMIGLPIRLPVKGQLCVKIHRLRWTIMFLYCYAWSTSNNITHTRSGCSAVEFLLAPLADESWWSSWLWRQQMLHSLTHDLHHKWQNLDLCIKKKKSIYFQHLNVCGAE